MGRISDEDIGRVRDATDLAQVISERMVLKPKGHQLWGLCPFHGEKTASFKVDPSTQLWHCFGCGSGGDVFGFVMRSDNLEFGEAVRMLADRANIELAEDATSGVTRGHKERLRDVCSATAEHYNLVLRRSEEQGPSAAREYLKRRGFGGDVAKEWVLGFAPGRGALVRHLSEKGFSADEMVDANVALRGDGGALKDRFYDRIMFPISDVQGSVIAFGGRVLGKGEPKYLNTNDTPIFQKKAHLYGLDRAKGPITASGEAIVVEGYTDVIALHQAGVRNAVAVLGTALGERHLKLLGRFAKRVVYLFDGDEAGLRAADRAVELIDEYVTEKYDRLRADVHAAVLPEGFDPADLVSRTDGPEALRKLVAGAQPLLRFVINRRLDRWDLDRPEERVRAMHEAADVLARIKGSILAADYANEIADRLGVKVEHVMGAIPVHVRSRYEADEDTQSAPDAVVPLPESTEGRVERELVALMVGAPDIRNRARELLTTPLVSEPVHRAMLQVIAEEGASLPAAELIGKLEERVPGSSAALSPYEFGGQTENQALLVADGLVSRLKELDLVRRIAEGTARLKKPESFKDSGEYDDLFMEVPELQRELDRLRRGAELDSE